MITNVSIISVNNGYAVQRLDPPGSLGNLVGLASGQRNHKINTKPYPTNHLFEKSSLKVFNGRCMVIQITSMSSKSC